MRAFCLLSLTIAAVSAIATAQVPTYRIAPGSEPRLFCYTNRQAAFYAGVLNGGNASGFHGITQEKQKLFEDYWIRLGDQLLDRRTAEIEATPTGFRRRYPLHNTVEEVYFSDSLTLLSVMVSSEYRGGVRIYPAMSTWWVDAVQSKHGGIFRVAKSGLQGAVAVSGLAGDWEILRPHELEPFTNPAPMHLPLCFHGQSLGTFSFTVEFLIAGFPPRNRDISSLQRLRLRREQRIEALLAETDFSCGDAATTEAFRWIAASMNALVMRQNTIGIYAGLPWFDDYWGRDTFISLPGALLVTGRFETAREVLRTFLRYMDKDTTSATYGRIPNRVQPRDVIYNTVDGTPWMVIQAWQYYRYSGDRAFIREIYLDVERTISGALRHVDENFLLTHGDAETWMDAVGPDGPWSPRGDRALEIQALWYAQLRAAENMAMLLGDASRATGWRHFADKVRDSVHRLFIDADRKHVHDHLNVDGSRDLQLRPNFLFPLTIPGSDILDGIADSVLHAMMQRVFSETVFPYGVASLSQEDSNFHPWHEAPRFYPKDAAYHNGTVWTWLTGPAVTALARRGLQDSAWILTRSLQRLAMNTGAVGTIPECTDALPHDGEQFPRWSGTFSQAWSNAEYLRNWYQDYLGVTPEWGDDGIPVFRLAPSLPAVLLAQSGDSVAANLRIGSARLRLVYRNVDGERVVQLRHLSGSTPVRIALGAAAARAATDAQAAGGVLAPSLLEPGDGMRLAYPVPSAHAAIADTLPLFAVSRGTDSVLTVQSPPWPQVDGAVATRRGDAAPELCSAFDPEGDDRGADGSHSYPANAPFIPGIADIRHFDVRSDDELVYFTVRLRALSQPGWHPEYGFQLTMLAIAIDQSHDASKQAREVGYGSGFAFPAGTGFDRLILVGGGVRVVDGNGGVLCEFIPEKLADAFGDPSDATIRFAIPRECLGGGYNHWQYTVISGLQDDHGGAGIGEFRAVLPHATEWNGGGGSGMNWYDVLRCPEH